MGSQRQHAYRETAQPIGVKFHVGSFLSLNRNVRLPYRLPGKKK